MHQFDKLPDSAYVRQAQLLGTVLPFSGTTLWRMVKDGHFPSPAKLGAGVTAWRVGAVRAWLHERESGTRKPNSGMAS
jgi:predicted DNA-binding transcriptional regulator AlpA